MERGFALLTAYAGPIGAFLYVLGCREPLFGQHEAYVAARWRQVLGSTMHCVAGDGMGILAGAVIGSILVLSRPVETVLEYVLGFGFGWTSFRNLFMRGMSGSACQHALASTFMAEFLLMNVVTAGMVLVASFGRTMVGGELGPLTPEFWLIMSTALLAGFVAACPLNWWLVARGLKHGMWTVRSLPAARTSHGPPGAGQEHGGGAKALNGAIAGMAIASVAVVRGCLLCRAGHQS